MTKNASYYVATWFWVPCAIITQLATPAADKSARFRATTPAAADRATKSTTSSLSPCTCKGNKPIVIIITDCYYDGE